MACERHLLNIVKVLLLLVLLLLLLLLLAEIFSKDAQETTKQI